MSNDPIADKLVIRETVENRVVYRDSGDWEHLQTKAGYQVKLGLPGLRGPEAQKLYDEERAWLAGSARPGEPL